MRNKSNIEPHRIIFPVSIIALAYVILYEFVLMAIPGTESAYKGGVILSKIAYSTVAASVFYLLSVYLPITRPKKIKKMKILYIVFQNIKSMDSYVQALRHRLGIDSVNDLVGTKPLRSRLKQIEAKNSVANYPNWHQYLFDFKSKMLDIIRSTCSYSEFVNMDMLHELLFIENQLLKPHSFEQNATLKTINLSFAEQTLREVFNHHQILQKMCEGEEKKYEKVFERMGRAYRNEHYNQECSAD